MKTTYTNAFEAIEASIDRDEITYADASCVFDLLIACDDHADQVEFWGEADGEDEYEWRVHIIREEA